MIFQQYVFVSTNSKIFRLRRSRGVSLGNRLAKSVADNALRFYTRNREGTRMISTAIYLGE